MKKHWILCLIVSASLCQGKAQSGVMGVSLNLEGTIPGLQDDQGIGFSAKYFFGIGKSSQWSLSAGYSRFNSQSANQYGHTTTQIIPLLLGYKHYVHGFFVEPKIGFGELGGKIPIGGDWSSPSVAAIFGGLGIGYTIHRVNICIQLLAAKGIENSSSGIWHNKDFHFTGISFGYDIFVRHRR